MAKTDYQKIESAIHFLLAHQKEQPTLNQIAEHIHLSPYHFQRLFVDYAGVSPKQFLQFITTEHAKRKLQHSDTVSTSFDTGLSGTGRLYDHFIKLEGVTPGEFKTRGDGATFFHGKAESKFGDILIFWTKKGIHKITFIDNEQSCKTAIKSVQDTWPLAKFVEDDEQAREFANTIFHPSHETSQLKLWVKGSAFQLAVWRALLEIQNGQVSTYKKIAEAIERPKAYRAVGTAIGANPIAYLIPCHRVIQQTGMFGGYRWKPERKSVLLGVEFSSQEKCMPVRDTD